jgi:hypothetical protein
MVQKVIDYAFLAGVSFSLQCAVAVFKFIRKPKAAAPARPRPDNVPQSAYLS